MPIAWQGAPIDPTLVDVIGGLTNVFFAYRGNMAVFSFCSEMKRPQGFKKSFIIVQGLGILSYTVVGATIYTFGGQYVTTPGLTMTTRPVRITAYSIALVTIMISGIISVNVGAMHLYIVVFRRKDLLTSPLGSSFKRGLGEHLLMLQLNQGPSKLGWIGGLHVDCRFYYR